MNLLYAINYMHENLMNDDFWCVYICLYLYISVYVIV
jgi:hypothetical protein